MEGRSKSIDLSPFGVGYGRLNDILETLFGTIGQTLLPEYIEQYMLKYGSSAVVHRDGNDDGNGTRKKKKNHTGITERMKDNIDTYKGVYNALLEKHMMHNDEL